MACREIRDPVHGFISVDDTECKIIDAKPFQRLRGIHQLALARQLYPGATHSRFEHSLGVYHVAGSMCDQLDVKGDERRRVVQAALLHDIGHGPFSHVSEGPLGRYATPEMITRAGGNPHKIHELVTCDIIRQHPEIVGIEGLLRTDAAALISGEYPNRVLKSIVSGPLDADKQDYLLRDSLMCGVRYGVFDMEQLHLCLVQRNYGDGPTVMVSQDGVHAIEQFAMAKYYITTQVYRHRVRLITDQMLVRAIILGVEVDDIDELRALYSYDGSEKFIRQYTEWDDWRLLQEMTSDTLSGKYCHRLLNKLRWRELHKQVFERPIREFPGPVAESLMKMDDTTRSKIEENAAEILREAFGTTIDSRLVICHAYTVKSVRTQSRDDTGGILIDNPAGPSPFEQESTLFRSIDESESEAFIDLFAPVNWSTPDEKKTLLGGIDQKIADMIVSVAHPGDDKEDEDATA